MPLGERWALWPCPQRAPDRWPVRFVTSPAGGALLLFTVKHNGPTGRCLDLHDAKARGEVDAVGLCVGDRIYRWQTVSRLQLQHTDALINHAVWRGLGRELLNDCYLIANDHQGRSGRRRALGIPPALWRSTSRAKNLQSKLRASLTTHTHTRTTLFHYTWGSRKNNIYPSRRHLCVCVCLSVCLPHDILYSKTNSAMGSPNLT